ncbi:MAG: sensor histidine kinase [Burkholderiales bacterium]
MDVWLQRLLAPPSLVEGAQSRTAIMLHAILMSAMVLLVFLFAVHIPFVAANKPAAMVACTSWLGATLLSWWLKSRGLIRAASVLHCSVLYLLGAVVAVFSPAVQLMLLIPAVMHWGVLLGLRTAAVAGALSIGLAFFLALGGREALGLPIVFNSPPLAVAALFVMPLLLTIVPVALYVNLQRRAFASLSDELRARRLAESKLQEANEALEAKVQARTAELRRANEELTAFSQRAAHDIRGAIGQVTGFVGLALATPIVKSDERTSMHLARATEAGRNLAQLVDSLLSLATLGAKAIKWSHIDLDMLVGGIRDDLAMANPDRGIEWEIGALGDCAGDLVLLRTVFQNLLGNAVKFTRHRPDASIAVRRVERNDGLAEIVIADNGVGFDMSHVERVFAGFQRLHSSAKFEGHGIGLASSRKIVLMHGGSIEVASSEDSGATFRVLLPTQAPE